MERTALTAWPSPDPESPRRFSAQTIAARLDTSRLKGLRELLVSLTLSALVPALQAAEMVSVNRPTVNMREGAGTHSRILGKAVYGEVLRTLAHRKAWVKVKRESGLIGWISRRLVWGW